MREIKFRAWDKTLKTYLPNVQNHIGNEETAFGYILENDRYVIEQFTGMKDMDGKDIYEGDIVDRKLEIVGNIHENNELLNEG